MKHSQYKKLKKMFSIISVHFSLSGSSVDTGDTLFSTNSFPQVGFCVCVCVCMYLCLGKKEGGRFVFFPTLSRKVVVEAELQEGDSCRDSYHSPLEEGVEECPQIVDFLEEEVEEQHPHRPLIA